MNRAQHFLNLVSLYSNDKYRYPVLFLLSAMALALISNSSYALATNPGAVCPTGSSQGSLTNNDYSSLVSAVNTTNYVDVAGNAAGSIPLQVRISTVESSNSTVRSNFGVITADNNSAINIRRTFPNTGAFTDINLDFRNTITAQPIYLTNVALSAFDIDYSNSNNNTFDDFVQITGVNESGNTIAGSFQNITGSNIIFSGNLDGLLTRTVNDPNCPAKNLSATCQGSVQFSQPVTSVRIRYSNTGYLNSATNQEFDFRLDNYCYVPRYIFTGFVFNDNGGITANNNTRQNISSTFVGNSNYFNGLFESTTEQGIAETGLTVRLTDCNGNNISTTSAQTVSSSPLGRYRFEVMQTALGGRTRVCLVENEPSAWPYTIDTTPNNREVTLVNNVYNYKTESNGSRNLDFGEVRADNAALVLIKSQYVHECNDNLSYQSVTNSTDPTLGFSINPISDISPGNCIAYRIQAYNRGHIGLDQVRISDVLQTSPVTSRFQQPTPLFTPTSVASPTVAYDTNGTIQSNLFNLAATQSTATQPTSAILYFNTKYGTTETP